MSLRSLSLIALGLVLCCGVWSAAPPVGAGTTSPLAEGDGLAAIVLSYGPERCVVRIVPVPAAGLTGLDALRAAGIVVSEKGGLVCALGVAGCRYPDQDCMCALPNYWSFWRLGAQGWRYAPTGAATSLLGPGQVDGWAWGAGGAPPALDAAELLDPARLAPDVPQIEGGVVRLPYAGDANGNAAASAILERPGWSAPLAVARQEGAFVVTLPANLGPGQYTVTIALTDADGVNGSATWVEPLWVEGSTRVYLAAVAR